jgi:hypothetical protein
MQGQNGAAKGNIARFQRLLHRRLQTARHIPIVGLQQDMIAADEIDTAIDDRLIRLDVETLALLGRDGLLKVAAQPRVEHSIGGPVMRAAPRLERFGRAVRGEQGRVQRTAPTAILRRPLSTLRAR